MRARVVALTLLCAAAPVAAADEACAPLAVGYLGSVARDRERLADLAAGEPGPSRLLRRGSDAAVLPGCPAGVGLAPVETRLHLLGGYPDDRNDGAMWSGRGASSQVTAGLVARLGAFSLGVLPSLAWEQNRDFPRRVPTAPGVSPFANPYLAPGIDLPDRMGEGDRWTADPGQSFVRADLGRFALGLSTENLWWGPGARSALLLTNTAPGFPHLFAGTREAVDVWIGRLEARLVLGRLSTSRYLHDDRSVDHAALRLVALTFEPAFARGLHVGAGHALVGAEEGTIFRSLLRHLASKGSGWPDDRGRENAIASLFVRWVLPPAGLELYGEWARDDTSGLLALAMEPERSSAYLAGLQKRFGEGPRVVRVQLEHVDTFETPALNAPLGVRAPFYTHQDGTFYTHRGGLLGAFVGPAGESQLVAVDVLRPRSSVGLFATRRLRNMLAYYESFARPRGRDLELGGGGRAVLSRGSLDLDAEVSLARRWNAEFLANRWQPGLRATLTWWPGRAGPR